MQSAQPKNMFPWRITALCCFSFSLSLSLALSQVAISTRLPPNLPQDRRVTEPCAYSNSGSRRQLIKTPPSEIDPPCFQNTILLIAEERRGGGGAEPQPERGLDKERSRPPGWYAQ